MEKVLKDQKAQEVSAELGRELSPGEMEKVTGGSLIDVEYTPTVSISRDTIKKIKTGSKPTGGVTR